MTGDGADDIRREMERNALRIQNGLKLAMGTPFARVGPTPKTTVWSRGKVELWRYDTDAVELDPPILLVPSVVSRSYVFDLHRGNSFVERLLEAGFAVYLVDWGIAGPEESGNVLEVRGWGKVHKQVSSFVRGSPCIGACALKRRKYIRSGGK